MERLIELLNEYEKSSYEKDTNWVYEGDEWEYYEPNNQIIKGNWENKNILTRFELCSKQFGFIKWLVDNDKIDFDNRELKDKFMEEFERYPTFNSNTYKRDFNENGLLMLLSIQDNPIEFLISILK